MSIEIVDEESDNRELARILGAVCGCCKEGRAGTSPKNAFTQARGEKETRIKIRVYWKLPPGAHATWTFAFTYVCQLHSVYVLLITLPPDGAILKVIQNHHAESGGRQDANIVFPYDGKRLYARGSPKVTHMRTKRLKFVRSISALSSGV